MRDLYETAGHAHRAGWDLVPVATGLKSPPASGFQGAISPRRTFAEWHAFVETNPDRWGNLALRFPPQTIGLDVDAYDGKQGADSLAQLGQLPPTWRISARYGAQYDQISGIRLYRLPEGTDEATLVGGLAGMETLRLGHRYAMAPSADHPSGWVYQVLDETTGEISEQIPNVADLPMLPDHAIQILTRANHTTTERSHHEPTDGFMDRAAGRQCYAMDKALGDTLEVFADSGRARHDIMSQATFRIVRLATEGHHGATIALELLKEHFITLTEQDRTGGAAEAEAEFDRAVKGAWDKSPEPDNTTTCNCTGSWGTTIWELHPLLVWCDLTGRARAVSREAILGATLTRISGEINPYVRVGSPIGTGSVPMSLYCFAIGSSGTGKTQAMDIVQEAWAWTARTITPATAEGLAREYAKVELQQDEESGAKKPKLVRHAWRVVGVHDEYATLVGLKSRSGNLLAPVLRTAWSGGRLGMSYRSEETRIAVEAGSYRLALYAGIQPSLVLDAFAGTDVGDPQRWLWFMATDPQLPDDLPDAPPLADHLSLPDYATRDFILGHEKNATTVRGEALHVMPIPQTVQTELVQAHLKRQRGEVSGGDAHINQMRLRLAGILALAQGSHTVSQEDWDIAGQICQLSSLNRDQIHERAKQDKREGALSNLIAQDETKHHADAHRTEMAARAAWQIVRRHKHDNRHTEGHCTRRCIATGLRRYGGASAVEPALDLAQELHWVKVTTETTQSATGHQPVTTITLGPSAPTEGAK